MLKPPRPKPVQFDFPSSHRHHDEFREKEAKRPQSTPFEKIDIVKLTAKDPEDDSKQNLAKSLAVYHNSATLTRPLWSKNKKFYENKDYYLKDGLSKDGGFFLTQPDDSSKLPDEFEEYMRHHSSHPSRNAPVEN